MSLKTLAKKIIDREIHPSENAPETDEGIREHPTPSSPPENGQEVALNPVSLAERIGIKYEQEIPEKDLGKPAFIYRDHVLAWEADPPHIRLYAWATVNLFPGRFLSVDIEPTARLLGLSPREVKEALARLTKDGDLARTWEKGRELYRLNVKY